MYPSKLYPTDAAAAEAFVAAMRHGTLVAVAPGGHPQVSILPFLKRGEEIELHCVQEDPTFAAVQANPRVTFLVSDFLAFTPHHFVDARDAGVASLHFRAVAYECLATVSTDPADVAGALRRLLEAYEPGADYEPMGDNEYYGFRLRRLAALKLRVLAMHAKFKAGPGASAEVKRRVSSKLRERGEPGDVRAADVIDSYTT